MGENFDVLTPINKNHFGQSDKSIQYLATISVCLAALAAGTVLAWSSPAIMDLTSKFSNESNEEKLINVNNFNDSTNIFLTKSEEALLGSIVNVGALVIAIPTGYIADKFGRKIAVYLSGLSFLLGWIIIIFGKNIELLITGRFFGGMGLGTVCVVAPMYIGEIAEHSMRAVLSSYFQMFLSSGIFITFALGAFMDYVTMSIVLSVFPLILLIIFPFMPESHVYLMKSGQIVNAEECLSRLRGINKGYDIRGEMEVIQEEINRSKHISGNFNDIFKKKSNRRALLAVLGVCCFQQLCGINAITFYTEQIFFPVSTSLKPSTAAILMAFLQCIGGYLAIVFIDKAGRRFFLILSSAGMIIGLSFIGIFFHLQKLTMNVSSFAVVPVLGSVIFIVAFTLGYGAIPYMLIHELFSAEIRELGSGAAVVVLWFTSFLVTYLFPLSITYLSNYSTFYILTLMNILGIFFVISFVPETRGKSLLEIQDDLKE